MKKTTIVEVLREYGESVLSAHKRSRSPMWDQLDELNPGEAAVLDSGEWTLTSRPSQMLNRHYRQDGRKFRSKKLEDGKLIIARIE